MDPRRTHPVHDDARTFPPRVSAWETLVDWRFAQMPAYDFLVAGDGTHVIDGKNVTLVGSANASALAIGATGLSFTRSATGYVALSVDAASLYPSTVANRWRTLLRFPASQTAGATDIFQFNLSQQTAALPSGANAAYDARIFNTGPVRIRATSFYTTWGAAVDTSIDPQWLCWDVHGVAADLYQATAAETPVPDIADMSLIQHVGHRSGPVTANTWGGTARQVKIVFYSATASKVFTADRLVIQRLRETL